MEELVIKSFSSYALCRFHNIIYPSQTPEFTYKFCPGAYAFTGQIDNGGWAFTYALTALKEDDVQLYGEPEFKNDGKFVTLDFLRSISCYLGYYNTKDSAQKLFAKLIKSNKIKKPLVELKEIFGLTNERFDKPLSMVGNEIWRITAALGFAEDKRIFCYPWRTNNQLKSHIYFIQKLAEILKANNSYLFIPVENDHLLRGYVHDVIDLSSPQLY